MNKVVVPHVAGLLFFSWLIQLIYINKRSRLDLRYQVKEGGGGLVNKQQSWLLDVISALMIIAGAIGNN